MTEPLTTDLYGQFVRIAPTGSDAFRHVAFERFGFEHFGILTDLGSTGLGLIDADGDTLVYPADEFDVRPWSRRRVHVFWYGHGRNYWTWCREVDGEINDYFEGLPRCADHADALAKALAWLAKVAAKNTALAR